MATPKAHCEDTNIINKQQSLGEKHPDPFKYPRLRGKQKRKGAAERSRRVSLSSLYLKLSLHFRDFQVTHRWNKQRRDFHYALNSLVHLEPPRGPSFLALRICHGSLDSYRRHTHADIFTPDPQKHPTTCSVTKTILDQAVFFVLSSLHNVFFSSYAPREKNNSNDVMSIG